MKKRIVIAIVIIILLSSLSIINSLSKVEEYDTLQEYKKALKEKCDAIDKAIEYINHCEEYAKKLESKNNYILTFKLLSILRGEDNE